MDLAALTAQQEVARVLMSEADPRWERIVVNLEVEPMDGQLAFNSVGLAVVKTPEGYRDVEVPLGERAKQAVSDMRQAMADGGEPQPWTAVEVVIDRPAAYRFDFAYDPPPRINGRYDERSYYRFTRVAQEYEAERRQAR